MISDASTSGRSTYVQILRSAALIGGSSVVNIAFGIIRTKVIAVLLGPSGIGIMSLYSSIADLTQSIAGVGVHGSGVRQIAETTHLGDTDRTVLTATALRRLSFILGFVGAALLLLLAQPISSLSFGSPQQSIGVSLLSLAVFFRSISAGQTALLQGMRRIKDIAMISMLAAFLSTVVSILLIYFLQAQGIVLSLISTAAISTLLSWIYSRRVFLGARRIPMRDTWSVMVDLLKLGAAFVASSLLTIGAAYAIRIILLHHWGLEAAGLYQAAWTLGGMYVGFILQSMSTDFYPRLSAIAADNAECNRLVNEQAHVSMLLAGPGIMATLTLAPLVMTVFYSSAFQAASDLVRWVCLGMMLRVIAWPMGFIVLAKNAQRFFIWTEVAAAVVHVGLAWLLSLLFGLVGAGAAFCGLYIWHSILIYLVVRRLSGFRWSAENIRLGALFLPSATVTFCGFYFLTSWQATAVGAAVTTVVSLYSLRTLLKVCPPDTMPSILRPWLARIA